MIRIIYTFALISGLLFVSGLSAWSEENSLQIVETKPDPPSQLVQLADQRDAEAMRNLGLFYLNDRRELEPGMKWLEAAADRGDAVAMFRLFEILSEGTGVPIDPTMNLPRDIEKSRLMLNKAADVGQPDARRWIAWQKPEETLYGAPSEKRRELLEKASVAGNWLASSRLWMQFESGSQGVSIDREKARRYREICFDQLYQAAASADRLAAGYLAKTTTTNLESLNHGVKRALDALGKGATPGDPAVRWIFATFALSVAPKTDFARQAIDIFEAEAALGNPAAYEKLGYIYFEGSGVQKNISLALDYLEHAISCSQYDALMYLADAYLYGKGVPVDREKARAYFQRAVDAGVEDAAGVMKQRMRWSTWRDKDD